MGLSEPEARTDNWGRWGPEDERGAANLLTPEVLLAALGSAREGKLYELGLKIRRDGIPNVPYRSAPQRLTLINQSDEAMLAAFGASGGVGCIEDVLMCGSHSVTHLDALSHVYADGRIYNGFGSEEATTHAGAGRCGIEKAGPIVTRGILADVAGEQGVACLEPGQVIGLDEFEAALDAGGLEPRPGDAVLFRTGWLESFFANDGEVAEMQPGIGLDVARALAAADVTLVGADNTAVEAMPFDNDEFVTVHIELLVRRGIYLLEHLRLDRLAADGRREFLFAVAPLPFVGATASPVNPFAIA